MGVTGVGVVIEGVEVVVRLPAQCCVLLSTGTSVGLYGTITPVDSVSV